MNRIFTVAGLALLGAAALAAPARAAEPDNLVLPAGFHASVVAEAIPNLRHLAVRADGTLYASTRGGGGGGRGGRGAAGAAPPPNPGIIALTLDGAHKVTKQEHFGGVNGGTGIRFYKGALYTTTTTDVLRFTFKPGETVPSGAGETIVSGMPGVGFTNRAIAFDDKGGLYVSVGGSGNICAPNAARGAKPVGELPCPGVKDRGGVWRFNAAKAGQKFPADGQQVATGLRDTVSLDYRQGDGVYLFMHDRAGTHDTWPDLVSEQDEDNLSEELHRMTAGKLINMGWPYTYYDSVRKARVMAPEYGGDGKLSPPDGIYTTPVLTFHPSHSAPLGMSFYYGSQFPRSYRGGAFVARHGGQGPDLPQGHSGYDVVFIPFTANGKPGAPVEFATGFAGATPASKSPAKATYRPSDVAVAPDGSLYVAETQKGRIWRITYDGK